VRVCSGIAVRCARAASYSNAGLLRRAIGPNCRIVSDCHPPLEGMAGAHLENLLRTIAQAAVRSLSPFFTGRGLG